MRQRLRERGSRGQVLPLFALFLVVLLAFAALAVDVSGAYSARRSYRSAADAASLAGAQDLQIPGSRTVTSAERIRARGHARDSIVSELGIAGALPGACDVSTDVDVTDACVLPGTTFHLSIRAGAYAGQVAPIACQRCDPARSVQVGLRNASFPLTFARVLGQSTWNVGVVSVAGLGFARSYAVVTLRPPKATGSTFNVNDIVLNSNGTIVNVHSGDVGSNANMDYSGVGAVLNIDSGYGMFYFDPYNAPGWYTSPPFPPAQIVQQIPTLITDPGYRYPVMSGATTAPTFDDARASQYATEAAVDRADTDPSCMTEALKIDASRYTFMTAQLLTPDRIYCYNPGIYLSGSGAKNAQIVVGTGDLGILKPGAYYLKSGIDIGGRLVGGYEPARPGVAIMLDESGPGNCSSCVFLGNNAQTLALNAGTKFPRGTPGVAATAAVDWDNQLVQTSGPSSPTPPILMSLLVRYDTNGTGGRQACVVPTTAPFVEPAGCQDSKNQTINIAGGGQLDIEGVQYMPTDNVAISGSSDGNGTVGQIISWTLTYSGSTTLNQEGAGNQGPGVLRLDAACTAPGTPCNP